MMRTRWGWGLMLAVTAAVVGSGGCGKSSESPSQPAAMPTGLPGDSAAIAQRRGLSPADVSAALATYMPTGRYDDYVMFASGGHSGQVFVIGLPSMRLLRVIAAFTPESWQGYGFGVKENPLTTEGSWRTPEKQGLAWADTHHPALSETNGDYDGQYLFIGDKASGRLVVIDLRDFEAKQIVDNPIFFNNHGAAFVTPNTEYVVEGSQYAMPLGGAYAPIAEYQAKYRGMMTFWKFDRQKGRIVPEQSFAVELPPYWQDLADAGKLASDGWAFVNSFNTEMATGGIEQGNEPFESGVSQRDMDYLHLINWRKAEQTVAAGGAQVIKGLRVISMARAVADGILYLVPEPKSPHGVDVCPEGGHLVVAGKLDPHVTIYGFGKIQQAIAASDFEGTDPFGIPIIRFDAAMEAQVELGLGPLHTQFDNQGYAYTSLFLESAVARWSMGNCKFKAPEGPWKLVGKTPVHYNIGHLAAAEGDTVNPDGTYLVALNKWSVDRFLNMGPLLPQNLQLVDIAQPGERMPVLYDMPIGNGEPHYAQIMKADKLKAWEIYPEVGWDTLAQAPSPHVAYESRIERQGNVVDVHMTLIRSHFDPEHITVREGDHVRLYLTNLERTRDATHGFAVPGYNIAASIEPGETVTIEFLAKQAGVYPFYCLEFCSALHLEMAGYLFIEPAAVAAPPAEPLPAPSADAGTVRVAVMEGP